MKKFLLAVLILLTLPSLTTATSLAPLQADVDTLAQPQCTAVLNINMRYRMRDSQTNNEVSALQDFLNAEGYLASEPTGFFGLATLSAVKKFQSASGYSPTGYVGPLTRAKVNSMSCGANVPTPTTPSTPTRTTPSTVSGCLPGYLFSSTTGKACAGVAPVSTTNPTVTPTVTQSVTVNVAPGSQDKTLSVTSSGGGTVSSSPAGINCGSGGIECTANFSTGTHVSLTATAKPRNSFTGWSGLCSGTGPTCYIIMYGNSSVTPIFTPITESVVSAPTLTFTASPATVTSGQSAILSWSSTNATSCTTYLQGSEQYPPQNLGLSGSDTGPFYETRTHIATCTGPGGTITKSVTVTVTPSVPPLPTLTVAFSPSVVTSGQLSTLTWSSTNATSCTGYENGSPAQSNPGNVGLSGSDTQIASETKTYTFACTGVAGTVTKSVTVTVN